MHNMGICFLIPIVVKRVFEMSAWISHTERLPSSPSQHLLSGCLPVMMIWFAFPRQFSNSQGCVFSWSPRRNQMKTPPTYTTFCGALLARVSFGTQLDMKETSFSSLSRLRLSESVADVFLCPYEACPIRPVSGSIFANWTIDF